MPTLAATADGAAVKVECLPALISKPNVNPVKIQLFLKGHKTKDMQLINEIANDMQFEGIVLV